MPAALLVNYRDALWAHRQGVPGDPDAAALYAEAALYVAVGNPRENREGWTVRTTSGLRKKLSPKLLPYFQSSLAKFPQHVGLLHFYIHAAQDRESVELGSRRRLRNSPPSPYRQKIRTSRICRATHSLTSGCIRKRSTSGNVPLQWTMPRSIAAIGILQRAALLSRP